MADSIPVIDSHTGGEPTRVVIGGVDSPAGNSMHEKRATFAASYDWLRRAVVCEPRGHEALVGALLCEPATPGCVSGVIFFNNVGCLQGCLHGTIGVAVTLLHLGWIEPGGHKLDTPSGVVSFSVCRSGRVVVQNIRSYRYRTNVEVEVPGYGNISGDIAWGGNWFFLAEAPDGLPISPMEIPRLSGFCEEVRKALSSQQITGPDGAEIDHIEIFGPPSDPEHADSRNFVLCPGLAYDRSPCGTGTSAKLACLFEDGKLAPGQLWRQAGIVDSVFEGVAEPAPEGGIYPTLRGSAFVTAESELILVQDDPFIFGFDIESTTRPDAPCSAGST